MQGEVIQSPQSQKVYPGQVAVPVRGNAAARRQYMANRRGDGSGGLRKGHQLIIFGIAVIIILLIVLIVLLAVLLPREESGGGKSNDDDGQSSHNAPGYCSASATQCLPL